MDAMQPYASALGAADVLGQAESALPRSASFQALPSAEQQALTGRLDRVRRALMAEPQALARPADPYDTSVFAQPMIGGRPGFGGYSNFGDDPAPTEPAAPEAPRQMLRAVNELPAAAGAMMEELGFADFVAALVHSTFDAIVDSSIRQMEAFASLVASLSQTVEDFSADNVTTNQVRDWLVERHPRDLQLVLPTAEGEQPRVLPRQTGEWGASPNWLADFDLDGEDLTEELIETQIVPRARIRIGEDRMRTLASMTLMGMNRVRVERGEINAKVRIRAKASDQARVGFAQDQDSAGGGGTGWSGRSGFSAPAAQAMVSTSVNAQSDGAIAAELQGEVRIVFASDTVPLESFVTDAQRVLLERTAGTRAQPAPAPAATAPPQVAPAAPAPTAPVQAAPTPPAGDAPATTAPAPQQPGEGPPA